MKKLLLPAALIMVAGYLVYENTKKPAEKTVKKPKSYTELKEYKDLSHLAPPDRDWEK